MDKKYSLQNMWVCGAVTAVILGLTMFFIMKGYYESKIDSEAHNQVIQEANQSEDFSDAINLTTGKLNCTQFKYSPDVDYCNTINGVRANG